MSDKHEKNDTTHDSQPSDTSVTATNGEQSEPPHLLSIDEVARRTELSKPTLRFYEQRGLVDPLPRTPGKFRKYGQQDLEQLERVKQLRDLLGLSLTEIEETLRRDKDHARLVAQAQAELASAQDETLLKNWLDEARRLQHEQSDAVEKQLEAVDGKIEGLERLREEITARRQRIDELENDIKQVERDLNKTR